jgi:hypothetical protein
VCESRDQQAVSCHLDREGHEGYPFCCHSQQEREAAGTDSTTCSFYFYFFIFLFYFLFYFLKVFVKFLLLFRSCIAGSGGD